jgi:ribosomal protein L28
MKRTNFYCRLCGKGPQMAFNRPKSQHKTNRVVLPNLQKWNGFYICNRCRKTINNKILVDQPVAAK